MNRKGFVHIYTGEGKGKTTAAVGLAVRARSQGMRVCFVSFHKTLRRYGCGEYRGLRALGVSVRSFAKAHPLCVSTSGAFHRDSLKQECRKGVRFIDKVFSKALFDLVILDEIIICVRDGFLREDELLALLKKKPAAMEVVLTGRGATPNMIRHAHLVSYIKEVKHPYREGVGARKGIEY